MSLVFARRLKTPWYTGAEIVLFLSENEDKEKRFGRKWRGKVCHRSLVSPLTTLA